MSERVAECANLELIDVHTAVLVLTGLFAS
jgi:hypothetical protein